MHRRLKLAITILGFAAAGCASDPMTSASGGATLAIDAAPANAFRRCRDRRPRACAGNRPGLELPALLHVAQADDEVSQTIGVIGAGTMGTGIAQVCALAGFQS